VRQERSHRRQLHGEKLAPPLILDQWAPALKGDPLPPRQRMLGPQERVLLRDQVRAWISEGVIEPRTTQPLNNNLVFVPKKNGDTRVCIDCTPVNLVTQPLDWPLPRLQDIRFRVKGSSYYSRIDLKSAFFRIRVPPWARVYLAFTSEGQQYQFRKMPFGVTTGPAVFQRFMDTRLADLSHWAVWYIDDILVHAATLSELRFRTRAIKRRLQGMGCEVNEDKSEYDKRALLFLGMWVFSTGVGPNVAKVREVMALAFPTTKKDMQSALGLVSYLRDFVPLVSFFTASLSQRADETPPGREDAEKAWFQLKRHLVSAITTLRHWDDDAEGDLFADASQTALGVILIQKGKVVALASRKLSPAETRYSATDREHLALVFAANKFRVFLHRLGVETRVWTDHEALINRQVDTMTPRQTRWWTIVNQWIPQAKHVAGAKNPADFVSRWGLEISGGAEKV